MILDYENISRIKNALTFHSRGISITEIAHQLKMNRNSVAKYLEIMQISGQVEVKIAGTSKIYTISQRVPLSAMLGFSSDMVIIIDSNGRIIQVNDPFLKFAEVSREDLMGRDFSEIPIGFLKDLSLENIRKGGPEQTIDTTEKKVGHNGTEVYLRIRTAPTLFEDGNEGATILIENVTERKNLESSLRESEEKYRNVVETQTEFICRFRPDGTHVFVNEAYCRYFGKKNTELIGKKFRPAIPPEDQVRVRDHFAALAREHQALTIEHRIILSDGSIRWQQWVDRAIFDDAGSVVEFQTIGRDVTERKMAELALEEREKLYRSVIENIQDVFYRSDSDGNLILASPSWAAMLGYDSLDECMGESIAGKFWMEPGLRDKFLATVHERGLVQDYEVVLKRRDGTPAYVSTNSHLYYDEAGAVLGVEGIFRDISERRAAAETLRHSIANIEFLSEKLLGFIELSPESDIFARIGSDLHALVPDAMILVASYDHVTGLLTPRSLLSETDLNTCIQCLGQSPVGLRFPIDAIAFNNLRQGRLIHVPLPLYDMAFGKIPLDICEKITASVNIGDIHAIGFTTSGKLFGNAVIYLHKGAGIQDQRLIETYAHQASIALQRRIAEESLKETREVFSEINELSPVPISIIDPKGKYLYINRSFSRLFGYRIRDFQTGRGWFLLAYPDPAYRKNVIATWKSDLDLSKAGKSVPRTFIVRCKDGTDKEVIFRLITLSDGKQCIIYEDITGQVQSVREKTLLSSIIESADVAIIGKAIDGTIISWNPAAERMYGYSQDEMMGRHISQITPPEKRREMHMILEKVRNRESVKNLETSRVRKDGSIAEIALTVSPILDAEGNVAGASSIAWDISLRKADERLKESEEKYRAVVENIAVGVYRSTGDPIGKFVQGNPALLSILGHSSLETLGEVELSRLFVEPDGRAKLLEELVRTGFVRNREIALRKADGRTISVLVTALAKINPGGEIEYISGLVEDITGRRETEQELQAVKKEIGDVIGFLPDPTFIIDTEKNVVAWNPAMERLTGIRKAEILGKAGQIYAIPFYGEARPILIDLIDATDQEIAEYYRNVKKEGMALEAEVFTPWLNQGKGAVLRAKAAPLTDPAGNRIGAIETIRDISATRPQVADTGRVAAPAGISPERENPPFSPAISPATPAHVPPMLSLLYLSNALKLAHDAITLLDQSARCVWVNDALVRMLGAGTSEAIAGKSFADFIIKDQRAYVFDHLTTLLHSGPVSLPFSVITSTGDLAVDTSISGISDEHGELLGYMLILRNNRE